MNCVYLVYDEVTLKNPELLSVDYNFFGQARPGDLVRFGGKNLTIKQKIFDPQEMDMYVVVLTPNDMRDKIYKEMYETFGLLETVKQVRNDLGLNLTKARDYVIKLKDKKYLE